MKSWSAAQQGGPEKGLSGLVSISQGHVSIHGNSPRVSADIFTCERFDVEKAIAKFPQCSEPRRNEWQLLDRGSGFPPDMVASRALVGQERRRVASALGLEALR